VLVSLDGGPPQEIDLYSPAYTQKQKVYNTGMLETGLHTLTITCTGEKNSASSGYQMTVDAFDLLGTLMPNWLRCEQDEGLSVYAGDWRTYSDFGASGRSFSMTDLHARPRMSEPECQVRR
jgi:hypothetical protein